MTNENKIKVKKGNKDEERSNACACECISARADTQRAAEKLAVKRQLESMRNMLLHLVCSIVSVFSFPLVRRRRRRHRC